jgi:hypothetical protein
VTEDRFEDLDGDNRSAGERLAERDRTHPEPVGGGPHGPTRPEVPRASNKYAWLVGILMLMGLAVLLFTTTLPNTGAGLEGPAVGSRLRPFAAPSARGALEGEANVCLRRPCARQSGPVPACEVRGSDVVNLCQLRRSPLVLTFVFDRGADCLPQVDRTERVMGRMRGVRFATVFFSRKDRDELRNIVLRRRWRQPVAVDRDGAIANLYGVGGCPTTIFARRGGKVDRTRLGNLTEQQIRRDARRVTRG